MIAVLCGGVGAARLLAGARRVVPGKELVAIVNTGDDLELFGLSISPDLDTITYTLSGEFDSARGWGRVAESYRVLGELDRFGAPTWFNLGDLDFATHLFRTGRLADGAPLSRVTAEIADAFGVETLLVPMTDDRVRTSLVLTDGERIAFQEYFVHRRHQVAVDEVNYDGADEARPAPGVVEAIERAEAVLIAPSNPIVSIGPILAVPGIADALFARRDSVVAISPIVGGAALKGPADRLLVELGGRASVGGVAECLTEVAGTLVIDHVDAELVEEVEESEMRAVVTETVMRDEAVAAALTEVALKAGGR